MPRKTNRSKSASLRWKKAKVPCEPAASVEPPSIDQRDAPLSYADVVKGKPNRVSPPATADVNMVIQTEPCVPTMTYADIVKGKPTRVSPPATTADVCTVIQIEPCVPTMTYADVVKRKPTSEPLPSTADVFSVNLNEPCVPKSLCTDVKSSNETPEPCVAGPSHTSSGYATESRLRASRSQASAKFGKFKNMQCTCNSLTFLAFLYEDETFTRADLDLVLDKGNDLYKQARKRYPNYSHLTTDELPHVVPARKHTYVADMTQLSRYGTFGQPHPGAVDSFLDLEAGLSCLLSDVQYALLLMTQLCIAVFRTSTGRYGFFDPHSRTADGLPVPFGSRVSGTAVMLTFPLLSDMIDRLTKHHKLLRTLSSANYELKPVDFQREIIADTIPVIAVTDTPAESAIVTDDATERETCLHAQEESRDLGNDVHAFSDTSAQPQAPLHDSSHCDESPVSRSTESELTAATTTKPSDDAAQDTSIDLSKYSKQQKRKLKRRLLVAKKALQSKHKIQQKQLKRKKREYMTKRYRDDADFKKRQMKYIQDRYRDDVEFKTRQKKYIQHRYTDDVEFKTRQKKYIQDRYTDDVDFKTKQKKYIQHRYRDDVEFKTRQKKYIQDRYTDDVDFKTKQKKYIEHRYRDDVEFKKRQKKYIQDRYLDDVNFKKRQQKYIQDRYRDDVDFKERQRSHITQRYANDLAFMRRHSQLMRHKMRDRYKRNLSLRSIHNMTCATNIKMKYRQMRRQRCESNRQNNTLIEQAIALFRSQIKAGPTFVCTVCHKASFPNQVKPCIRSYYVKNPDIVASCLTGKYLHVCDERCRSDPCNVPDARKREWICHTCHNYLKDGVMPALAMINKLELAYIPPELCDLNILERHLVAKCIPFAKIIPLPKGRQRAIHGNVICVPSEVQETVDALPRLRGQSQVMRVKLKRRLCYKGHQLFQTVNWTKLVQALHKLKQIHPQYENIIIREDEPELCDPTLPDDDDDDDDDNNDDEIMSEYDESDLMEIEQFERNALCDPNASDVENDEQSQEQPDNPEQEGDMPYGGIALESCLQPRDVSEEILSFTEGIYSVAPAEGNNPVSFFKTPKLEAMAFPVQFPTGQNTLDEQRNLRLTPSMYFKSRLFGVDGRFARDTNYLFFAQFVTEIHLATSSMSIQLRKGKPFTRDGRKITSGMLQDKQEVEKLVRNKDAVRFMQPLRGTPVYWEKTTRDLFAMIRQLGSPTFFCTFSAAEMRWPEVIEAIKTQQGERVTFHDLDWSTKCDILRSNPVTTMRMFDKRVEALYRDLLLSPAQPLGNVVDFFYRVEFQNRGSPHIHCLIWVAGAPVFEEDFDQTVCDFVSKYITCQLPDPHAQPELHRKVKEVQMHSKNHSRTCFKSASSGCRFGFPKPPSRRTMITRPDDETVTLEVAKNKLRPLNALLAEPETASLSFEQLLAKCELTVNDYEQCLHHMSEASTVVLKRDPKDCWINAYNPHLLDAWDANIDVQFILNYYSLITYICSYICKSENSVSDYLKTLIENSNKDHVNESDEMKEIMQAYSKKREVSAQECVARACGINMRKFSRGVIFVPTDQNPLRMSRPMSFLENATDESENVWMTSLTDKYLARPETPEYEQMCLADFASTCRIVYGKQAKGKNVLPLLNDLGFVQMRKSDKPAVIRYHRTSQQKNPEQFYCTLLRLYLPHRSNQELTRPAFPTYEAFYNRGYARLPGSNHIDWVKLIVDTNRDKYEKHSEDIDNAVEEFEQNRDAIDEWCNLAPESEMVRLECIEELQARPADPDNIQENVPDYNRQADAAPELRAIREPPAIDPTLLRQMYQNLNQKQACVFYAVRQWCNKRVCGQDPEQFFYFINGGAGTGKSHLIKCIHSEASKILRKLPRRANESDISTPTVLLTAFTGTAAFNISGTTLHSLLKLPRNLRPPFTGLGNQLDEVRCELWHAEIIVIDEISMVSRPLFAYVDARLKQIKGTQKPFGGMSVLAVGDFYQLPPVRHSRPLCVHDPCELDLWHQHFQIVTLTQIMRQKDDVAFAEMLNRIRVKAKYDELCEADRSLLMQTVTEPDLCPKDALHIFATNRQVASHNSATLTLLHSNVTTIDADDYKREPQTGQMTRQATPIKGRKNDLPDKLEVAEGARVMLTRNIDVSQGLVNGSFATLVRMVTSEHSARAHVTVLGLRMDDETAGRSYRNTVPGGPHDLVYIKRTEESLKQKGMVRCQFPIKLAFACTIHKVQGMTRSSAVVSLKHIFEPGMAYVAISRVTSLSGLHMLDVDERKMYANAEVTGALQTMTHANLDHLMPVFRFRQTLLADDTLIIVHHNTEGLQPHISDIKCHHEMLLADVLCLTETHLQGSTVAESLHLQGYQMFNRNRYQSYTALSEMACRGGGGVAIYVKNDLQVHENVYLHNVTDLEFVAVKVEAPVTALIAAVYRPPDYSVTSFLSNLSSLLDSLQIMDCHPIIVCGDFNENLLSDARTPITELFFSRGYAQLITGATTEKNTLLDLIFISRPQRCLQSGVLQTYFSYHNPVYCVMSINSL